MVINHITKMYMASELWKDRNSSRCAKHIVSLKIATSAKSELSAKRHLFNTRLYTCVSKEYLMPKYGYDPLFMMF